MHLRKWRLGIGELAQIPLSRGLRLRLRTARVRGRSLRRRFGSRLQPRLQFSVRALKLIDELDRNIGGAKYCEQSVEVPQCPFPPRAKERPKVAPVSAFLAQQPDQIVQLVRGRDQQNLTRSVRQMLEISDLPFAPGRFRRFSGVTATKHELSNSIPESTADSV